MVASVAQVMISVYEIRTQITYKSMRVNGSGCEAWQDGNIPFLFAGQDVQVGFCKAESAEGCCRLYICCPLALVQRVRVWIALLSVMATFQTVASLLVVSWCCFSASPALRTVG